MKTEKNNGFTHVKIDNQSFTDFFLAFKENYVILRSENLVIDFSNLNKGVDIEKITLFSSLSENHQNNGKSFVIVASNLDFDSLPDEIIVVPTLQEAKDIIEMEEIERDLLG